MAAWICALVAFLNGAAWSIITPPFQGRDEPSHFAYVQQLVENGGLPHVVTEEHEEYSPQESVVLQGLQSSQIRLFPQHHSLSSESQQRTLERDVGMNLSRKGSGEANVATSEPPLYYALQTVPYALGGKNTLAQLELMRLFDALLAALTVVLIFLFIRELLPGSPWVASVGALCGAVQPLFGFMAGTVNPETMLYTVCAALLLCLARAFRRGLTLRLAIVLGTLIAVGFLTKLNFVGVAFGAFVALTLLGLRELRARGVKMLAPLGAAAGIGISPVALYALANVASGRSTFGYASTLTSVVANSSIPHSASYVWQLYLPRLPGMVHYLRGVSTLRDVWFDRFVGLYGWIDTQFPPWVYNVALVPAAAILLLLLRALFAHLAALRVRWVELLSYAAIAVGLMAMIGLTSFSSDAVQHLEAYADPRYLLPLLPLMCAAIGLAVRGAGRRWAPVAGALIVMTFLAHDLFSQMQEIARYYG